MTSKPGPEGTKSKRGRPQKPVEADTFSAEIGKLIRETRDAKGFTAAHCAEAAGVARSTWYHFERGRSIGLDKLPKIATALGVKVREIIPADFTDPHQEC